MDGSAYGYAPGFVLTLISLSLRDSQNRLPGGPESRRHHHFGSDDGAVG